MPSHRATDAAHMAPYLTHAVSHHGQVTLVPPDNAGRVCQAKPPKNRVRQRQERSVRQEEGPRFDTGPRPLRNLVNNRGVRRFGRQDRTRDEGYVPVDEEEYPDYPPPSFLEATSSPPAPEAFVSNATPTLVSQPTSPITADHPLASPPPPVPPLPISQPHLRSPGVRAPIDDIDSDVSSLEVIEMESEGLPSGSHLNENHRRGVEPSAPLNNYPQGPTDSRHAILGAADPAEDASRTPESALPQSSTKRKNMALSPLRTLFPYRLMAANIRPFSAHPSANSSPYASRTSIPFLSATSLKLTPSTASLISSTKGENFISRKLLSLKGKERAKESERVEESLDTWEVVPSEARPNLLSTVESMDDHSTTVTQLSPNRSQSFTYGTSLPSNQSVGSAQITPFTPPASASPHPLSMRDRKVPPVFPSRPKRQVTSPPPPTVAPTPISMGPIITSVRTRIPPAQQQMNKQLPSSPPQTERASSAELDTETNIVLERAIVTPLPLTPVDSLDDLAVSTLTWPGAEPTTADLTAVNYSTDNVTSERVAEPDKHHTPKCGDYAGQLSASTSGVRDVLQHCDDHLSNGRRHYPGRPLPLPPRTTFASLDDMDATDETPTKESTSSSGCMEGLLIDLEDGTVIENPVDSLETFTAQSSTTGSSSSVDLLGSIVDDPSPSSHEVSGVQVRQALQTGPPTPFAEITDLDVLASRLDGEETQNGSNYDALLLLSEFIGPATPIASRTATGTQDQQPFVTPAKVSQPAPLNRPLLGNVEIERRRTTKDGRVKLKLVVLDAPVDKCGICLKQFKSGDLAQLESACRHAFHDKCLVKWLARSNTCPMCRVSLAVGV